MVGNCYSRVGKIGFQRPREFLLNLRLFFAAVGNPKNLIFQATLTQVVVHYLLSSSLSEDQGYMRSMQTGLQEVSVFYNLWYKESIKHLFLKYTYLVRGVTGYMIFCPSKQPLPGILFDLLVFQVWQPLKIFLSKALLTFIKYAAA